MRNRPILLALLGGCAVSALSASALADPSGRVGRISQVEGEVSFRPPAEDFWTPATRNFPVAPGESFWTGDSGRTELQFGSVEAWIDSQTELDVLDLDYGETRLALVQGSLDLRIWRVPRGGVRISTPAGQVLLQRAGVYRVDVAAPSDDGGYQPVEVTTFDGAAELPSPGGIIRVDGGEAALVYGGELPQAVDVQEAAIDDWARDREARQRRARDDDFTLAGYGDLDDQGEFLQTAEYGTVWFPRDVPADWAPYRYGHWAYVQPWGWTWIDDQAWGFAPFHYGRWARVDDRWGWIPPDRSAPEPVYAPALVAFIGGLAAGASLGGGEAMGWVPLGPEEVYRPPYQVSRAYIHDVNITNVRETTINNVVVNNVTANPYRNAPAATVVRTDAFTRGAAVQHAMTPASAAEIARAAPLAAVVRPPMPTPQARTGLAGLPEAGPARPTAAITTAPPPPTRLQAVRSAIAAQPPTAMRPPMVPMAGSAPPRPPAAAGLIAPAQVSHPSAQGLRPPPPPRQAGPAAPAQGAVEPGRPVIPLRQIEQRRPQEVAPPPGPRSTPGAPLAPVTPNPLPANRGAVDNRTAVDRDQAEARAQAIRQGQEQLRARQAAGAQAAEAERRKAEADAQQQAQARVEAQARAAQDLAKQRDAAQARARGEAAAAQQRDVQARAAAEARAHADAAALQAQKQQELQAKAAAEAKARAEAAAKKPKKPETPPPNIPQN